MLIKIGHIHHPDNAEFKERVMKVMKSGRKSTVSDDDDKWEVENIRLLPGGTQMRPHSTSPTKCLYKVPTNSLELYLDRQNLWRVARKTIADNPASPNLPADTGCG